jgi:ribosomal protein L37AE/L43A
VASTLQTRIKRLEDVSGAGGECPRCAETTVTYLSGAIRSVSRYGRKLTPEEAEAFEVEEENGRCPVCGATRLQIKVGWPVGP